MRRSSRVVLTTAVMASVLLVALTLPIRAGAEADSSDLLTGAPTVVYLLRHAEAGQPPYGESSPDPSLVTRGSQRAEQLVHLLADAGVTRIFSTEYRRTQETVKPLSQQLGLEVEPYDPRALEEFARRLRSMRGRVVVSGHSNTTPALVRFLGGDPAEPIDEKSEFDRLYVVLLRPAEPTTTILLRYGSGQR